MPDTARLIAEVLCPTCGVALLNSARFSWGGVPGPDYKIGDSVRWVRNAAGEVLRPFCVGQTGTNKYQWNCVSPSYQNVIVLDEDVYPGNNELFCLACKTLIRAVAARVTDGKFESVSALTTADINPLLGESAGKAFVVTLSDDGTKTPQEDWFDHVLTFVEERCTEA